MGAWGGGPPEISQASGGSQGETDRQADGRGLEVHLRQLRDEVWDADGATGSHRDAQPGVPGENDLQSAQLWETGMFIENDGTDDGQEVKK